MRFYASKTYEQIKEYAISNVQNYGYNSYEEQKLVHSTLGYYFRNQKEEKNDVASYIYPRASKKVYVFIPEK